MMDLDDRIQAVLASHANDTPEAVARALGNALVPAYQVAAALYEDLNWDEDEVAQALYAPDGLDLDAAEVAKVLYFTDALDLDAAEVVDVLSGLGLSAAEITAALHDEDGLDWPPGEVAAALQGGLGLSAAAAAEVVAEVLEGDKSLSPFEARQHGDDLER